MSPRLPRTRTLLRAGLLDWNKLATIMSAIQGLDDEVCALVEAAAISDADLAVAEPLDVLVDPTRPGSPLPAVARVNNPTLRAQLHAAIAAIEAEAAARRSRKARSDRAIPAAIARQIAADAARDHPGRQRGGAWWSMIGTERCSASGI